MTTTIIIVISLLVLLIGALIVRGVFPRSSVTTTVNGPFSLSETKSLGKATDVQNAFLKTGTGTVQAFVYLLPYQRTGQAVVCSSGNASDPKCGSGRYSVCPCNRADCTNCQHKGFQTVLNLSKLIRLEILNTPDASRPNSAYAHIVARTVRKPENTELATGSEVTIETFPLPPIPFQKWTMVTIALEGRRVDVFYNDEIVLSKRCDNILDVSVLLAPLISGSSELSGQVGKVRFFDKRLTLSDVKTGYKQLANTKGEPDFSEMNFSKLMSNLNPCPNGNCLPGLTINPPSGLAEFQTIFS